MKAVVIKTKGKDATLLRDDGQFILTKNYNYQVGEVILMKKNSNLKRILALAASAAMIVMLLAAGAFAYATPAYYVSLDINPSLLMEVNVFERLIGIEAMNEDAESILADLEWKNKNIEDVLAMAVQKIEEEGYFDEGGNILVAAAGKGEARKTELLAGLKEKLEELDLEDVMIETESVGEEMVAAAKEFGLTPGKYNLITKLLGDTVTAENAEDYLNLPVKELMARFTAIKGDIANETAESAKQNDAVVSLPSEAVDGQQTAEQKASEASQKASEASERANQTVSEATQRASEAKQDITETLPVNVDQLPETPPTDVEIPEVPVETPELTLPASGERRP